MTVSIKPLIKAYLEGQSPDHCSGGVYNRDLRAALAHDEQAEAMAWRVRVKSDDPEEWSLLPAGGGADYLRNPAYEVQPLYAAPVPEQASVPDELIDWMDVSAFGVFKCHAIPVDVCRHIARRVNEKYAEALRASPRSAS